MREIVLLRLQVVGLTRGVASMQGKHDVLHRKLSTLSEIVARRKAQARVDSAITHTLLRELYDVGPKALSFERWSSDWLFTHGFIKGWVPL